VVCRIVRFSVAVGLYRIATETWSALSTVAQGTSTFAALIDDCPRCMSLVLYQTLTQYSK